MRFPIPVSCAIISYEIPFDSAVVHPNTIVQIVYILTWPEVGGHSHLGQADNTLKRWGWVQGQEKGKVALTSIVTRNNGIVGMGSNLMINSAQSLILVTSVYFEEVVIVRDTHKMQEAIINAMLLVGERQTIGSRGIA